MGDPANASLLLVNDGQNMNELGLENILENLYTDGGTRPIVIAAIHASVSRKIEYGTAIQADYLGRGAKAGLYTQFIRQELLPMIQRKFPDLHFSTKAFAGFSLGGLMALDIVWNYPGEFITAGVFPAHCGGEVLIMNMKIMMTTCIASCTSRSGKGNIIGA